MRVTPRSTTSRSAAVNSRFSSGLMKRESDCSTSSSGRKPEQLRDRVVRLEDLALQVRDEHRVRRIGDDDVRVENLAAGALFGFVEALFRSTVVRRRLDGVFLPTVVPSPGSKLYRNRRGCASILRAVFSPQ